MCLESLSGMINKRNTAVTVNKVECRRVGRKTRVEAWDTKQDVLVAAAEGPKKGSAQAVYQDLIVRGVKIEEPALETLRGWC